MAKQAKSNFPQSKAIIHAAARDAGNRSADRRGLSSWDKEANNAAHAVFEKLFEAIGGTDGWIDLPIK